MTTAADAICSVKVAALLPSLLVFTTPPNAGPAATKARDNGDDRQPDVAVDDDDHKRPLWRKQLLATAWLITSRAATRRRDGEFVPE